MYISLYCKARKGCVGFHCERELVTEQKLQYFDPYSYGRQRCVFLVLQMLNRSVGFLYCILSASSQDPNSSGPQAPSTWCGFLYHISPPTGTRTQLSLLPSWLSYIIVQRSIDRPLDLWNRMFNSHQAEITVMQFPGHSLPMQQSMSVPWEYF